MNIGSSVFPNFLWKLEMKIEKKERNFPYNLIIAIFMIRLIQVAKLQCKKICIYNIYYIYLL